MAHLKPAPEPDPKPAALIQSVDRAISVLELLAKQGRAGITEIAEELGVHKSTASRLVSVLENRGLVEELGEGGKDRLGGGRARGGGGGPAPLDRAKAAPPGLRGAAPPARRDGQRRGAARPGRDQHQPGL